MVLSYTQFLVYSEGVKITAAIIVVVRIILLYIILYLKHNFCSLIYEKSFSLLPIFCLYLAQFCHKKLNA